MTSKIVVNNIEPDAGISTVTVNGDCQATTFKGDGSNLTGIDASSIKNGSDVKVQANSHGAVVTGIATITGDVEVGGDVKSGGSVELTNGSTFLNKNSVGIGSTTTAGRNAGVSTATGNLIFNASDNKLEVYNGNAWLGIAIASALR